MIAIGARVPDATLNEFFEVETGGCALGPNSFSAAELARGRKIVVFGLPGAFTPTCSAKHVPGFVAQADALRAAGVDEIWCVSVNDAFVMGAWGREQNTGGRVRMMADGSAEWTRRLGLEQDLTARGMGVRSKRYAMVLDDGVVSHLWLEAPGEFKVSSAEAVLAALRA
ncbi:MULTISPECIES: peroxiredoxin [Cupriavidus]|uniref:Glutathione-dependent peroxiredoxin n=1 Tax=Cupriavidus basilensis OR16 TaxID=1127483 RepID=H1SEC0_9BURK|nr:MULTISPECIES: peroxiredoxin [Cupriavidus]EHP39207.1 peroxiredoxin [Cupriavidus basilensis OR16]MCY0856693.1 peroxiredoxin [Cupriavidus sp. D39]